MEDVEKKVKASMCEREKRKENIKKDENGESNEENKERLKSLKENWRE